MFVKLQHVCGMRLDSLLQHASSPWNLWTAGLGLANTARTAVGLIGL